VLKVSEVFTSIEGEVTGHHQGRITTFIRMFGCNLDCSYCDTEYAKGEGEYEEVDIKELADSVKTPNVTITGGEPLFQKGTARLIYLLSSGEKRVTLETNGCFELPEVTKHPAVSVVMDHKVPADFFTNTIHKNNSYHLAQKDVVKFVIWNRNGFDYVLDNKHKYPYVGLIAVSGCEGFVSGKTVMEWILNSDLKNDHRVVVNCQLHKLMEVK